MYIVDILVDVMFNKACVECITEFIYHPGICRNFRDIGGMMSYFHKPSSAFSFISIHRARWSPTSIPKDKNPPQFSTRGSNSK